MNDRQRKKGEVHSDGSTHMFAQMTQPKFDVIGNNSVGLGNESARSVDSTVSAGSAESAHVHSRDESVSVQIHVESQFKGYPKLTAVELLLKHKKYICKALFVIFVAFIFGVGFELAASFPLRLPNYFFYYIISQISKLICRCETKCTDLITLKEAKRMSHVEEYKDNVLALYLHFYAKK